MRIGVISRDVELVTTNRFLEAGAALGFSMIPLRLLDGSVIVEPDGPQLWLRGEPLSTPLDAFVPRLGAYLPSLALALSRALEHRGAVALNSSSAMELAFDKLRTAELLAAATVPTPRTMLAKDLDHLDFAIEAVGGAPVVLKPSNGAQGRGVLLAESRASAVAFLESLIVTGRDTLVQELIPEARGEDRRLLVLDGQVLGAIVRRAREGEFRPNLHRGGSVEAIEPTAEESALAIAAANAVGLRFCGVDLLRSEAGPVVVEVNGSPGLEGIERATGGDFATAVLKALARSVVERGGA